MDGGTGSTAPCSAPGCEKPGTLTCARCQGARYCSKDCQRAAWSSHKTSCTASRRRVVAALDPEGGRLLEADAREFDAICVMARDCANQLHHLCDDFYELADDRVANGACVRHLGAYVYTHFLAAPMGDGVLAMMRRKATETLSHPAVSPVQARVWDRINADLQNGDVQFWGQLGVGRVFGRFIVLEQRPEGAVLVHLGSSPSAWTPQRVYLALGIAQSLTAPFAASGVSLPVVIWTTLVAFRGRVVYDGVMDLDDPPRLPSTAVAAARRALAEADAKGTLVSAFTLPDRNIPVDFGGDVTKAEMPPAAAGRGGSAKAPTSPALTPPPSAAEQRLLDAIARAPRAKDVSSSFTLRRLGYTTADGDNPNKAMTLIAWPGGLMVPSACTLCRSIEPTADEVADALARAIAEVGHVPAMMNTDSAAVAPRLRRVLRDAGVAVGFYAPPSPEEEWMTERWRPRGPAPQYYLPGGRALKEKPARVAAAAGVL